MRYHAKTEDGRLVGEGRTLGTAVKWAKKRGGDYVVDDSTGVIQWRGAVKPLAWYATTSAGGQQGLIADENDKTGRTIALTYDPKDAAPIAHAMNAHAGLVAFIKSFAAPNGPKIYRDMDHTDLFEILEGLNKEARAVLRAAGEL